MKKEKNGVKKYKKVKAGMIDFCGKIKLSLFFCIYLKYLTERKEKILGNKRR